MLSQIVVYADKSSYVYTFWANYCQIVVNANNSCTSLCTLFTDTHTDNDIVYTNLVAIPISNFLTPLEKKLYKF